MYFEYTITDEICVDNNDFRQMGKLVKSGMSYGKAFEEVAAGWEDMDFYNRKYIKADVIAELKRRMAQAEEAGK